MWLGWVDFGIGGKIRQGKVPSRILVQTNIVKTIFVAYFSAH